MSYLCDLILFPAAPSSLFEIIFEVVNSFKMGGALCPKKQVPFKVGGTNLYI